MTKFLPSTAIGGRPTFYGAYLLNKQKIILRRGWNEITVREYESSLINIIYPCIKNHNYRPLSSYTREDVDATIKTIRSNGYRKADGISRYDPSTLERFRYLMEVVIEAAADNYDCPDILRRKKQSAGIGAAADKKPILRSVSPEQEMRLGEILLTDPKCSGEYMAMAAMLCAGTRNAEACGLNFGDVRLWKDMLDLWVAWIYKTTEIDSNRLQSSGKTRNADRVVVLPDRFVWLVNERRQWLRGVLGTADVDELPLACRGNDFYCRCKADDVTEAAREVFSRAGILPEQVCEAFDLARRMDFEDWGDDPVEQTPTAYLLRRHYATSLCTVGLTEQEIRFQIGHKMDGPVETRNEFLRDDRLLAIKEKISHRAVVNSNPQVHAHCHIELGKTVRIYGSGRQVIHIPPGVTCVMLQMESAEPMDPLHVRIRNPSGHPGDVDVTTAYFSGVRIADPDVREDYLTLY